MARIARGQIRDLVRTSDLEEDHQRSRIQSWMDYFMGICAGGFVLWPQMAPMEAVEGRSGTAREDLSPVGPLDKIIVAFAGPLFSFLLALAFAVIVWAGGKPTAEADATTTVGYVAPGEPAARAGFQHG